MEKIEIKAKIAEIREKYLRLAWSCKAAGIRVNQETIKQYSKEIQELQARLN